MASETRIMLLEAARAELLEKGWSKTSGRKIRLRVEISHGSWVHAFPKGKKQAASEVYEQLHAQLWSPVLDKLRRPEVTAAVLREALKTLIKCATQSPAAWRLLSDLEVVLPQNACGDAVERRRAFIAERAKACAAARSLKRPQRHLVSDEAFWAVLLGPTLFVLEQWSSGRSAKPPQRWLNELAAAAVAAVLSPVAVEGTRAAEVNKNWHDLPLLADIGPIPTEPGERADLASAQDRGPRKKKQSRQATGRNKNPDQKRRDAP